MNNLAFRLTAEQEIAKMASDTETSRYSLVYPHFLKTARKYTGRFKIGISRASEMPLGKTRNAKLLSSKTSVPTSVAGTQ